MNTEKHRSEQLHPGVTDGKSFVSGVSTLGTPVVKNWQHGENSLNRHGHEGHSRDLSTPPHVADASSESLKMTMGERHRHRSERGNVSTGCDVKTTTDNHRGHEGAQRSHREGAHSSVSPCLRGEMESRGEIESKGASEIASSEIASLGAGE